MVCNEKNWEKGKVKETDSLKVWRKMNEVVRRKYGECEE